MNNLIPYDIQLLSGSREQYNNKSIKQYIALDSEDSTGVKVSKETCLVAQRQASDPQAFASGKVSLESVTSSPGEGGNVISPRELCSWSGISVHHVRTRKGVKVGISLQRPEWVRDGNLLQITAELKRYDRLREVKPLQDDSNFFSEYLRGMKEMLHSQRQRQACLGRAHQRGARKTWIQDILVLAYLEDASITRVFIYIQGEQLEIPMTHGMTEQQQRVYHSTGMHGSIVLNRRAPRLDDLPLTSFGGI